MEYGALVHNGACGSFSDIFAPETDFMDELFVEGCWVETRVGCGGSYLNCGTEPSKSTSSMEIIFEEESEAESLMVGKRWWIGPRANNPGPSSSVKERLVVAVGYLKEYAKNSNMVIQVWVPARRGCAVGIHQDYPYTLDYTTNITNNNNGDATRVFQFQEEWLSDHWTPNIRFLRTHDYPRLQQYDLSAGSLSLPVFQRGSGICLGVVEILMPNNVNPDLQSLQGVDFRSSSLQNFIPPAMTVKGFDELYQGALNEIVEVLTCVCKAHELPLALTWAPCIQQGKSGCGHSNEENYVSTVDPASFVADVDVLGFLEACSEYHLLGGQGVVGTAFTTAKPCFANDITAFTKAEYPLAHHANMFGLHAAVAIPLRSVSADFVLEFFLPKDCHDTQEQKQMLNSLSMLVQQACRSLHVVMDKEEEEELVVHHHHHHQNHHHHPHDSKEMESSSWIAHMMEAQQKGKGVSVSLEYLQEPKQEFKVTTNCNEQVFSELEGTGSVGVGVGGRRGGRKSGDKRRTKAEKTISLPVLRQYFAGSLKDAAKSIGVCPTTLKRICRQHGITRWPSRKIKKVGHSLRKLQLVIDSVQGAEGAIQIGSFYTSFPELSSSNGVSESSKINNDNSKFYSENGLFSNQGATTTTSTSPFKSPTSSCSQTCNPTSNQSTTIINNNNNNNDDIILMSENQTLIGASIQVQGETRHFTHHPPIPIPIPIQSLDALPPLPQTSSVWNTGSGSFRVKATFGDEKIRFSLQPNWGFRDLQMEIARRFNLNEISNIQLKYLDDAQEWVLLTCDADLEECKDINRSSQSRTVRLFLFHASPLNHSTNAFGGTSPT